MMVGELAANAEITFEPKLPTQHVIELGLLHECTQDLTILTVQ